MPNINDKDACERRSTLLDSQPPPSNANSSRLTRISSPPSALPIHFDLSLCVSVPLSMAFYVSLYLSRLSLQRPMTSDVLHPWPPHHIQSAQLDLASYHLRIESGFTCASDNHVSSPSNLRSCNDVSPSSVPSSDPASSAQSPTVSSNTRSNALQQEQQQIMWNGTALPVLFDPQGVIASEVDPHSTDDEMFRGLCAHYLNMLSQDEQESAEGRSSFAVHDETLVLPSPERHETAAESPVIESHQGSESASLCTTPYEGFLTSPLDSPYDEVLVTPAVGFEDSYSSVAHLTSPGIEATFPLISDDTFLRHDYKHPKDAPSPTPAVATALEGLIPMPTSSVPNSPKGQTDEWQLPSQTSQRRPRRRTVPNGTRPGITPDNLIAINAPTKPRNYSGPSSTAKKEVPKYFERRKRDRDATPAVEAITNEGDNSEERDAKRSKLDEEIAEVIETKRRMNTEAARRSRRRKLEHLQELEARVDFLERDRDDWKSRALVAEAMLKHFQGHTKF
jgi:hypothetical protein